MYTFLKFNLSIKKKLFLTFVVYISIQKSLVSSAFTCLAAICHWVLDSILIINRFCTKGEYMHPKNQVNKLKKKDKIEQKRLILILLFVQRSC